jgi:DNA-binding MarR family transcriptional regulator
MKHASDKTHEIIYSLMNIISKSHAINKKVMHFGTDSSLHQSEIHMIVQIAESNKPYIIGLANNLGITKGAVSQIVNKLEKKGMVIKNIDPDNRSKYSLKLTGKGSLAYRHHTELHNLVDKSLLRIFKKIPDNTIDVFSKTFSEINKALDEFI